MSPNDYRTRDYGLLSIYLTERFQQLHSLTFTPPGIRDENGWCHVLEGRYCQSKFRERPGFDAVLHSGKYLASKLLQNSCFVNPVNEYKRIT